MVVRDGGEIPLSALPGLQDMGSGQSEDVRKNLDGISVEIVILVSGGQKLGQGGDGDRPHYVDPRGVVGGVGIGGPWTTKTSVLRIGETKKR